jgi:ATP-dependent Clp protease adaptor protein ClpS
MASFFRGKGEWQGEPIRGTVSRTDQEVRQLLRLLPKYRVLLFHEPEQEVGRVVEVLLDTVPALSEDEAVEVLAEAQVIGASQVIVCLRELAEHYRECLERYGLHCEIEPA